MMLYKHTQQIKMSENIIIFLLIEIVYFIL